MPTLPHNLVSVRGVLGTPGTTKETWQWGLRMDLGAPGPVTATQRTAISNAVKTFHSNPSAFINAGMVLTEIRYSNVGTDGLQVGDTVVDPVANLPGGADSSLPRYPPQCSLVVSLLSGNRGKGQRGRVFIPGPSMVLEGDFTISTSAQTNVATAFQTMVNSINSAGSTGAQNGVVIIGHTGTGTKVRVNVIRVGQVIDTHRSRRRSLAELYIERPVAA